MTQLFDALTQAGWALKLTYGIYGLGYASLTIALGLGIVGLLKPGDRRLEPASMWSRATGATDMNFEKLNRKWIRFGFLMLAGGLVSHGTWDWGPWEYLSLLSGLSYGAVLHMHYVPAFKGRKALWASLGAWTFTLLVFLLAIY